jgi:hypothetical protein
MSILLKLRQIAAANPRTKRTYRRTFVTAEKSNPGGQPPPTAPGKPASRQPTDTGRDPSEPIDDDDEDQTGTIELPEEGNP